VGVPRPSAGVTDTETRFGISAPFSGAAKELGNQMSELMLLGPRYANGVIVTQVVPAVDGYSSAILKYRTALAKYFSGEAPDYVFLEGYVDGTLLLDGLKRAGPQPDTEKLIDGLETLRNYDMASARSSASVKASKAHTKYGAPSSMTMGTTNPSICSKAGNP
jgi:hypothetical protein